MSWRLLKHDLKRLPILFLGFVFLSGGIQLTKVASVGLSPWSVFHDGLSRQFDNVSFGDITVYFGLLVLIFSVIAFKTKVGLGTLLNIAVVGNLINVFENLFNDTPESWGFRILLFATGVVFTTFGRSLYIAANLGPGPRDGLFVGLSRISQVDVKYVKPFVEFIVLLIGFGLGGNFNVGTIVIIVVSGYLVQFFFKLFKFDPKNKKQNNSVIDYMTAFKKESQN